jgi:hypothetical protein
MFFLSVSLGTADWSGLHLFVFPSALVRFALVCFSICSGPICPCPLFNLHWSGLHLPIFQSALVRFALVRFSICTGLVCPCLLFNLHWSGLPLSVRAARLDLSGFPKGEDWSVLPKAENLSVFPRAEDLSEFACSFMPLGLVQFSQG